MAPQRADVNSEPVSHDTIGRLLQKLRPDILSDLLAELSGANSPRNEQQHIVVDGKLSTGSVPKSLITIPRAQGGKQPVTSVNAYSVDTGLVLACTNDLIDLQMS